MLRSAREDWLQTDADIAVSPILYPLDARQLIVQQNAIGWGQVLHGRFSLEWARIQQDYYHKHRTKVDVNKRRDGAQWQVKLISLMWDHWRKVWSLRNADVHGHDTITRSRAARASLARELREVYDQHQHLEAQVASLLHQDEHEHHRVSRST